MKEKRLEEVRCSSEAIRISSPFTTIFCSIGGTAIEALHDPTAEACVMFKFLMDTLIGSMPLVPTDRLFKSPSGLIFEYRGIARAVPIKIDKIEVHLDFHIYPILDFDLLIGYPLENLHHTPLESLYEKLGKMTSATPCLRNPLVKPFPKQNPLEEMMHVSLFISSEHVLFEVIKSATPKEYDSGETFHLYEGERSSSSSIEFEHFPTGPLYDVLNHDRDTTMIFHDESLEIENPWAMESSKALTLESKEKDFADEHDSFILETPPPCPYGHSTPPESATLCTANAFKGYNHLKALSSKTFRRMVVDAYVYYKHCKFCGCTVALILQLKHNQRMVVKVGTTLSLIAAG
jgi:hypothetical protein